MAGADTVLTNRPDIYMQSFLVPISVFLLAYRVESIYTLATSIPFAYQVLSLQSPPKGPLPSENTCIFTKYASILAISDPFTGISQ